MKDFIMKNMMQEYLGKEYSSNHLRNFCLYWMKARATMPKYEDCSDKEKYTADFDSWRSENDLDCLYLNGDLRADTLMSAWTPIKWVADCLNRDQGLKFYKTRKGTGDPSYDLKLLAEDRDVYLPPKHELVQLLDRFLELAELRCNFILLPDRHMNTERYKTYISGKEEFLYDEVPATLYHVFEKETLGKYFDDEAETVSWIKREKLEAGYRDGIIDKEHVIPLIKGLDPKISKWPVTEEEISEAYIYMIGLLENRQELLSCG